MTDRELLQLFKEPEDEKEYLEIKLEKEVDLITPGIDSLLGNPYNVKVERIVDYEE